MTTEFPESQIAALLAEDPFNLRVSVIHEDAESEQRAKLCLDRLARNLNVDANVFSVRWWSMGLLSDMALRQAAARQAGNFEIVFLSMHTADEPSPVLKEWLMEWLRYRNNQPCALAVLFDERERKTGGDTPLLDYLADVAKIGGLDLVCPSSEKPGLTASHAIREIANKAINASPLLGKILDDWESYPHWGIND